MSSYYDVELLFDQLSPEQNGRQFADDIFKCDFLKEIFVFTFKFHGIVLQMEKVTISRHLFR